MEITIREIINPVPADLALREEGFMVDEMLVLQAQDNHITYTIQPVTPYRKSYQTGQEEDTLYPGEGDRTAFIAFVEETRAGRLLIKKSWNNLAYIDDLCVDAAFRGQGIGARLMICAEEWARRSHLPGIMLETQNINTAACRLYARCGFKLCGFDTHLYKALPAVQDEIALYWYKML